MGEYFKKLIEHYASECTEERMIKLGTVSGAFTDVLIYPKTTDYTNIWNLISGNLIGASTGKVGKDEVDLSDYDRYLYIRRQNGVSYIDFVEDIGKASGQVIEFGKNLLDLSEYVDASNVYTQIIPLGKADSKGNRVDIKLVNGGKNYLESATGIALFGKIQKSVIWDDVTNRNTLKANGQRMLDKAVEMAIKITLRAFDLHRINVDTDKIEFGDKVHVVSLPHEISSDFLCSKIVYHLASLENTEYTFGLEFESMTSNYASYKRTYQYKMSTTMDDVSNAQSSADDKRRVFTSQPYPPYDVGDLWVGDYTSDIMVCQTSRTEDESYSANDWVKASKYTDDTKVIEAGKTATDYIKDGDGGVQVGPKGNSNVTMTDYGLIFHGIRNQEPIYNFGSGDSYAAGTVNLNLSKYSAVLLTYESKKGNTWLATGGGAGCISTVLPVNGEKYSLVYPWNTPHRRDVKVSPNGITFGSGGERTSSYGGTFVLGVWGFDLQTPGKGGGWNKNDSVCMPRQLFGFM